MRYFLGIEKFSPFVCKHFNECNIRSSLYLSSVVIALELWMLGSTAWFQIFSDSPRTKEWLVKHISCYVLLLIAGIVMLTHSVACVRGRVKDKNLGKIINIFFSIISIVFGMYISYLDYIKGEQFITLFTMTLFIFCFLIWRPIFSILFMSIAFITFYAICNKSIPATYATKVNLSIIWIAIIMAAINSCRKLISEAKSLERLEEKNEILFKLSITDEITDMPNMSYFISNTMEKILDKKTDVTKMLFLFMDIENFKSYNEKYGFLEGNEFLKHIGRIVEKTFKNSMVAHFSNDNFVVFTEDIDVSERLEKIRSEIINFDKDLSIDLKTGSYRPKNRECLPIVACDRARYACYTIKKHFNKNYCEYTDLMNDAFHKKQYIINNIDKALENNYIQVYYQPLINAKTGKLSGLEALARWNDPTYGLLMPYIFINTLEEYHQIHKLDMYILNQVCLDISESRNNNEPVVPVSLNFSRRDFDVIDLEKELESCLKKHNVQKEFIHVEITESALVENDDRLQNALKIFRKSGYALWLDDFGSGYSGLNVLKEYDFDVMKIDMKFLQNLSKDEKSKTILRNIVKLAKEIGMVTLTEGVETEEARTFLLEIGCEILQGYLFGKPMPKAELQKKISSGEYLLEKE